MFLVLLVLYGLQLANALRLEHTPHNVGLVVNQGELAVAFFLFGIARSWQLVGAREFGLMTDGGLDDPPGSGQQPAPHGRRPAGECPARHRAGGSRGRPCP